MKELNNFQIHFTNKHGKFIVSENPLGQETFTMIPNRVRHQKNIQIFTGRYHGSYYEKGKKK